MSARPTIKDFAGFNAEQDAQVLRKAMKGLGTDEAAIIEVLAKRSSKQRVEIKKTFATMFGRDLIKDLKSELSGNFENTILKMMMLPIEMDAEALRASMKGLGTDEQMIIDIMATRSNSQIAAIKETYYKKFKRNLEEDFISETSGYLKRALVSLAQANRSEATNVDLIKSETEAMSLYEAGENKRGTSESEFITLLVSRSPSEIKAISEAYQKLYNHSLLEAIQGELSGYFENALKGVVECSMNTPKYFARRLYESMKGIGTKDNVLIHTIVSRSEVDLANIKEEFQSEYGESLENFIAGDCSGDYQKVLLALVNGN